jgi:hypothetical protein
MATHVKPSRGTEPYIVDKLPNGTVNVSRHGKKSNTINFTKDDVAAVFDQLYAAFYGDTTKDN